MKVIGLNEKGEYIAIVTHDELEKCADKYYGKLEKLKIGQDFNIGEGYNFRNQIVDACKTMKAGHEAFVKSSETLTRFATMVAETSGT